MDILFTNIPELKDIQSQTYISFSVVSTHVVQRQRAVVPRGTRPLAYSAHSNPHPCLINSPPVRAARTDTRRLELREYIHNGNGLFVRKVGFSPGKL